MTLHHVLLIPLLLPCAQQPDGAGTILEAAQVYREGDFEHARSLLEPLAAEGDLTALCMFGKLLLEGEGGPADITRGLELVRRAEAGGSMDALRILGDLHATGTGVERDIPLAFRYLLQADALGHPKAPLSLARLLRAHPRQDLAAPDWWLQRGILRSHLEAQEELARWFLGEWGDEHRDLRRAARALGLAAHRGSGWAGGELQRMAGEELTARVELAWLTMRQQQDPRRAKMLARMLDRILQDRSLTDSQRREAWFVRGWYELHLGPYPADSRTLLRKAQFQGSTRAEAELAMELEPRPRADRLAKLASEGELHALDLLLELAREEPEALASLGQAMVQPTLLENLSRGATFLGAAFRQGVTRAGVDLGLALAQRAGRLEDIGLATRALETLRQAQQRGSVDAGLALGRWMLFGKPVLPEALREDPRFQEQAGLQALRWAFAQPFALPVYAEYDDDDFTFGDPRAAIELGYAQIQRGRAVTGSLYLLEAMEGFYDDDAGDLLRTRLGLLDRQAEAGDAAAQIACWLVGQKNGSSFRTPAGQRQERLDQLAAAGEGEAWYARTWWSLRHDPGAAAGAGQDDPGRKRALDMLQELRGRDAAAADRLADRLARVGLPEGGADALSLYRAWSAGHEEARAELQAMAGDSADARLALALGPGGATVSVHPSASMVAALVEANSEDLAGLGLDALTRIADAGDAQAKWLRIWMRASNSPTLRDPDGAASGFLSLLSDPRFSLAEKAWMRSHLLARCLEHFFALQAAGPGLRAEFEREVQAMAEAGQTARAAAAWIFTGPALFPDSFDFPRALAEAATLLEVEVWDMFVAIEVDSPDDGTFELSLPRYPVAAELLYTPERWQELTWSPDQTVVLEIGAWQHDIVETSTETTVQRMVTEIVETRDDPYSRWLAEIEALEDAARSGSEEVAYWLYQADNPMIDQEDLEQTGFYKAVQKIQDSASRNQRDLDFLLATGPEDTIVTTWEITGPADVPATVSYFSGTLGLAGVVRSPAGETPVEVRLPWHDGRWLTRTESDTRDYDRAKRAMRGQQILDLGERALQVFRERAARAATAELFLCRRRAVASWGFRTEGKEQWAPGIEESERAWREYWFLSARSMPGPLLGKKEQESWMPFVDFPDSAN